MINPALKCCLNIACTARSSFLTSSMKLLVRPSVLQMPLLRTISSCSDKTWSTSNVFLHPLSSYHCRLNLNLNNQKQPLMVHGFSQYSTEESKYEPEKKPSLIARFKQMYRDYWYVLVPVHVATSLVWFGGFYYLLQSGVDVVAILESYNVSETIIAPLRDSKAGYLAISYALYKIFTPLRYTVTLGGTTISITYLQRWGYLKKIPSRDRMKEMIQERKDNMLESVRETKAGLQERKNNILESVRETAEDLKLKTEKLKDRTASPSAITENEKRSPK